MTSLATPTVDRSSAGVEAREAALSVSGMDCASCVAHVEKAVRQHPGVDSVRVNLARGRAVVVYQPAVTSESALAKAITDAGYPAAPEAGGDARNAEDARLRRQIDEASKWARRALVGMVLWAPLEGLHWALHFAGIHAQWMPWASLVAATLAIGYGGSGFYRSALAALRRGTTNMDVLISMGFTTAYLYSLVAFLGGVMGVWAPPPHVYFTESIGLLALISLGHWLEARARRSAGSAIRQLLELAPATALRLHDAPPPPRSKRVALGVIQGASAADGNAAKGEYEEVPVSSLELGDRVLIRPGDRVPTDCTVIEGRSSIDESMISGEPLPVARSVGDQLIGGTVNQDGRLVARVTRVGSETALAQIVQLVETAQSSKPPVQRLADKISAVFVPIVLVIALITGVSWYVYGMYVADLGAAVTWGRIANAVCSVLLIACPCALGLAIPAALMVGTGMGARRGILIRDISALQSAEKLHTVVLDKTGTITQGRPTVVEVSAAAGVSPDHLLRLAASAEQYSEHPLAKAIVAHARSREITLLALEGFDNQPGLGVVARVEGQQGDLLVGHRALLGADVPDLPGTPTAVGTQVFVARRNGQATQLLGSIRLSDTIKPDSRDAIVELHQLGLSTVLLTGDNEQAARVVAAKSVPGQGGRSPARQGRRHHRVAAAADAVERLRRAGVVGRRHGRRRHQRRPCARGGRPGGGDRVGFGYRQGNGRHCPGRVEPQGPAGGDPAVARDDVGGAAESVLRVFLQCAGDPTGGVRHVDAAHRGDGDGAVGCHRDRQRTSPAPQTHRLTAAGVSQAVIAQRDRQ